MSQNGRGGKRIILKEMVKREMDVAYHKGGRKRR